ncbi:hypothetical protein [Chitinophaga rhizophila]|uniref:Uncharacterized protein n=1 Tax=Chitinophaga rhizophila TaxID=2866212 RepID=A0ABS7GD87_9BACT|nr:hypothetical protein [Chitinophaga rhizophila]MBW8685638.1 hypothetical protein [Chitinophaga rhizophila]
MAVPSLSVFLAKIADLIFSTFRAIVNTFGIMQTEKKVVRQLKELRKNSYVVKEDVEQLEAAYAAIRVRTAEQTINKLDRLSRD